MRVSERDRLHFAKIGEAFAAVEREDREAAARRDAGEKVLEALSWSDALRGERDASADEISRQGSLKARWRALRGGP